MSHRLIALCCMAALAGCGSASLKHAGRKAVVYQRTTTDPAELGTVALHTGICSALDPASLQATLGGRPLQLVSAGSSALNADGTCAPIVWRETTATPTTEAQTVVEISDGSESLHVTFFGLNQPPAARVDTARFVRPGSDVQVELSSSHSGDAITRATFDPSGRTRSSTWATRGPASSPDTWTVSVPNDAPLGPGNLSFEGVSNLATSCDADVECQGPTLRVGHGAVSTVSQVPFTTGPVPLRIDR